MNMYKYLILLLLAVTLFTACEKDYQAYDAGLKAVCFDLHEFTNDVDSLSYSFVLKPGIEFDTIKIPVVITGFTSSQDRTVRVVADVDKNTAEADVDYKILPCVIPANQTTGIQCINIYKTDNSKEHPITIALQIAASVDFVPGALTQRNFRIILINKLIRPSDWRAELGDYSEVKHQFIIEVTGMGTGYGALGRDTKFIYFMGTLYEALNKYNNAHPGEPMVDENGVPVTFPG